MCVNDPTKICIVPITRVYYSDAFAIVPIIKSGVKLKQRRSVRPYFLRQTVNEFNLQIENECNLEEESFASECETLLLYIDKGCIIESILVSGGRRIWRFLIISSGNFS